MRSASDWIDKLQLVKHPEGGYYQEPIAAQKKKSHRRACRSIYWIARAFSTAIYFLLQAGQISVLHRIKSDEVWHFYDGGSLTIHVLDHHGNYVPIRLGGDRERQAVVMAGCWFGAEVTEGDYVLANCTIALGFDFHDFEMADRRLGVPVSRPPSIDRAVDEICYWWLARRGMASTTAILSALYQADGQFIRLKFPSETLATELAELGRLGYAFESHPHFGHRLVTSPDRLIADDLKARLPVAGVSGCMWSLKYWYLKKQRPPMMS